LITLFKRSKLNGVFTPGWVAVVNVCC